MSNEIATYSMILSKLSLGKSGTECPTKTQILAINSLIVIDNASTYGANECVKIDDIRKKGNDVSSYGEWTISVSASPTSVSSSGGTSTITASAKRTVYWASGDVTEETGNPTLSTNLGSLSSSSSPSTLTLGENTSTSSRTATIKATHGGKSATCTVTQSGATPSTTYTFSINPYKVKVGSSGGSGSVTISSYKTVGSSIYDVDYSIDSSTLPSWASFNKSTSTFTIQSTTSTTGRTAKVYFDQDESGKQDYAELTQTGYTPPADNYVFTWEDGSTSDVSASFPWDFSTNGTAANIPVVSTKNGSSQSWSVSSKPSWITTSTTSSKVTISASDNSGSARSGEVVLTQSGSGNTLTIKITQSGYTPTYTFNVTPTNLSVTAAETNETLTVNSYKTVLKSDGSETTESLNYEFSSNASWVNAARTTTNATYITVAQNLTTNQRSAKITLTQAESGAQAFTNVIQAGKAEEVVNKLTLNSLTYNTCYLFRLGTRPVEPNANSYLMFMADTSINWHASLGITVNGGTAYAGNLVDIYVYSSGGYKLVKTFQLQLGEQTVIY